MRVRGDGVVAFVENDGSVALFRYDWDNNTPFYPAYLAENLLPSFVAAHGGNPDAFAMTETMWRKSASGETSENIKRCTLKSGITGPVLPISREQFERLAFVAVFTDGVTQVDNFGWKDAALDLLSFRSPSGSFAKRRMIKFVEKSYA